MLALVLAIGLVPATAAGATVALDTIVDVDPRATVTISQRAGHLVVRGRPAAGTPGIRVTGADVRVGGDRQSRQLVIVTGRQRRDRDTAAELLVPASMRLVIQSAAGEVTVEDMTGDVEIESRAGDVVVRRAGGSVRIESLAGDVTLSTVAGDATITSVSGDLRLHAVHGAIRATATSGDIRVTDARAPRVDLETTAGDLLLDNPVPQVQAVLRTHHGDVRLGLADGTGGSVVIERYRGTISASIPVVREAGDAARTTGRQQLTVGGGGPARITITTFTGDVQLRRATGRATPPRE